MGGAIGLRSLLEGLPVRAAAFTAPMWGIRLAPSLRPMAWALASGARAARLGLTLAPGTDLTCYVAVAPFEGNVLTTDPEMFAWMKAQVTRHPELGLGGPSLHWVHEALLGMSPSPRPPLAGGPDPDIPGRRGKDRRRSGDPRAHAAMARRNARRSSRRQSMKC